MAKLVRNKKQGSLKSNGAKYSTTKNGVTTYYKSSKDAPGYSDSRDGKVSQSKGKSMFSKDAKGNVITPESMQTTQAVQLPAKPQPFDPGAFSLTSSPALESMGVTVQDGQYINNPKLSDNENAVAQSGMNQANSMQSYLNNLFELNNSQNSGEKDFLKLEKDLGVQKFQRDVNNYTAQLNEISKKAQAESLGLEGQGRGITESIIGGQQAQINREAAIQALPIQAQLDAAQGNLDSANARLDRLFTIRQQDKQKEYDFKKGLIDSVFSFATTQEQNRLNAKLADIKTKQEQEQANLAQIQEWSKLAVSTGQSNLISQFTALDTKSPTFARDFGALQAKVVDPNVALDQQLKRAQIASANRANQPNADTNEFGTLTGKPQNVTQAAANGYADRIAQANASLNSLGKKFSGDFAFGGSLPSFLQSEDRQAYEQAKRNFATAVLRRESGASIAPSEFETLNATYFPARGDDEKVLLQKEQLRNTVINSFYREANVPRPVIAGDVIEDDAGNRYRVGVDGETLEPLD